MLLVISCVYSCLVFSFGFEFVHSLLQAIVAYDRPILASTLAFLL